MNPAGEQVEGNLSELDLFIHWIAGTINNKTGAARSVSAKTATPTGTLYALRVIPAASPSVAKNKGHAAA